MIKPCPIAWNLLETPKYTSSWTELTIITVANNMEFIMQVSRHFAVRNSRFRQLTIVDNLRIHLSVPLGPRIDET